MNTMQQLIAQFSGKTSDHINIEGEFQPHDLVLVHENPTSENLSNALGHELANVVVILLTDNQSREIVFNPKFKDKLAINLIIASTNEQEINIKFSDTESRTITASPNKPLAVYLNTQYGIPVIINGSGLLQSSGSNNNPSPSLNTKVPLTITTNGIGTRKINAYWDAELQAVFFSGYIQGMNSDLQITISEIPVALTEPDIVYAAAFISDGGDEPSTPKVLRVRKQDDHTLILDRLNGYSGSSNVVFPLSIIAFK